MKERPILFSAPMVRALLDGTKTQTRRRVKGLPATAGPFQRFQKFSNENTIHAGFDSNVRNVAGEMCFHFIRCPYGQPGDRLWVRETWNKTNPGGEGGTVMYRATDEARYSDAVWKPSIHMFQKDSRITIEVTVVRMERLQDISEEDAKAEGIEETDPGFWKNYHKEGVVGWKAVKDPVMSYRTLWESINGLGSWDANPWVWVVEFRRVTL